MSEDPEAPRDSACPRCGGRSVELIHGVPNADGYRLIEAGDRARGFSPETLTTPTHVCKGCGHYHLDEDSYALYARMKLYELHERRREREEK